MENDKHDSNQYGVNLYGGFSIDRDEKTNAITGITRYMSVAGWYIKEDKAMVVQYVFGCRSKLECLAYMAKCTAKNELDKCTKKSFLFRFTENPPPSIPQTATRYVIRLFRKESSSFEESKGLDGVFVQVLRYDQEAKKFVCSQVLPLSSIPISPSVFDVFQEWKVESVNKFCCCTLMKRIKTPPFVRQYRQNYKQSLQETHDTEQAKEHSCADNAATSDELQSLASHWSKDVKLKNVSKPVAVKQENVTAMAEPKLSRVQRKFINKLLEIAGKDASCMDGYPVDETTPDDVVDDDTIEFTRTQLYYINVCLSDVDLSCELVMNEDNSGLHYCLRSTKDSKVYTLSKQDKEFLKFGSYCARVGG